MASCFQLPTPPFFSGITNDLEKKCKQPSINKKMNGTESQPDPCSVSCNRAIRYLGLGVRSVGPVGDFLDSSLTANETDKTGRRIDPSLFLALFVIFSGVTHFRGKGVKQLTT